LGAPGAWVQRNLLELERSRIIAVTVTHGDGETIRVIPKATGQTTLTLEGLKAGETLQSDYVLADIFERFTRLQLEDVRPAKQLTWPETVDLQVEVRTKNGLLVRINAAKIEDQHWLRFTAIADPASATTPPVAAEATTPNPPTPLVRGATESPTPIVRGDTVPPTGQNTVTASATNPPPAKTPQQEAEELNARWNGWAYKLADWAYQTLNKRRVDLVKAAATTPLTTAPSEDASSDDSSASVTVATPVAEAPAVPVTFDGTAASEPQTEPQPSPNPQADDSTETAETVEVPATTESPAANTTP
jgi:hypothetical protein